jgi:hypothetical protein
MVFSYKQYKMQKREPALRMNALMTGSFDRFTVAGGMLLNRL